MVSIEIPGASSSVDGLTNVYILVGDDTYHLRLAQRAPRTPLVAVLPERLSERYLHDPQIHTLDRIEAPGHQDRTLRFPRVDCRS